MVLIAGAALAALAVIPHGAGGGARSALVQRSGYVQAVRPRSKAVAMRNLATHAAHGKGSAPDALQAAAHAAVRDIEQKYAQAKMHMLEETRVEAPTTDGLFLSAFKQMLEQERSGAKPAVAAGEPVAMGLPEPDKNPDKIMLKMYMESECPACRKFSTTIVKEVLAAEGLGDVIDFEYVAWGWGAIKTPPTERQLELDPHAGYDVLNHTAQLLPVLQQLKDPRVQAGLAAQPDILYQVGVCAHEGARTC